MDAAVGSFGALLRRWRLHRGLTQLALAADSGVSTRHLSWLETGRSEPSRAMVLRLAEQLDVPLRERNAWLRAAGYAAMYTERALADPALRPGLAAVRQLLAAHEPNPALAVDRHWQLVAANRLLPMLTAGVAPALLAPPVNVLRLALHPQGLAGAIENLPAWRAHVLARVRRQARASGDAALQALHDELAALGPTSGPHGDAAEAEAVDPDEVVLTLRLRTPEGLLSFVSTVTVFGAPHDVALAELAVETLLAADAATAERLRRWLALNP